MNEQPAATTCKNQSRMMMCSVEKICSTRTQQNTASPLSLSLFACCCLGSRDLRHSIVAAGPSKPCAFIARHWHIDRARVYFVYQLLGSVSIFYCPFYDLFAQETHVEWKASMCTGACKALLHSETFSSFLAYVCCSFTS